MTPTDRTTIPTRMSQCVAEPLMAGLAFATVAVPRGTGYRSAGSTKPPAQTVRQ